MAHESDSIVIIPTYNEKENIENIVRAVFDLEKCFHILIIDDGSPDGTAAIVKRLIADEFADRLFIVERTGKQQAEVISRVFHGDALLAQASASGRMISIERYLQNFLPFSPEFISQKAGEFMAKIAGSKAPDSSAFCKELGKFALRPVFSIFLEQCLLFTKKLLTLPQGTFACSKVSAALRTCQNNVLIYNQSPQSALEQLVRELLKINAEFQGIFSCIGL